jgi:hypothetical protein
VMSSVHLLDAGEDVRRIRVRSPGDGHAGRSLSFSGTATVVDADRTDRVLAVTQGMGIRVGTAPLGYRYVDPGTGVPDAPDLPPLQEAFGARRRGADWELPELTQRIGSTSGSLHHGPIQVVLEAAAFELAEACAGTDRLQIEDWTVLYLRRGRIGPFVTSGKVISGSLGRYAVQVSLRDEGNRHRTVSNGVAMFRVAG